MVIYSQPACQLFGYLGDVHSTTWVPEQKKSPDVCFLCTLRDGGTSRAVLDDRKERGAVQDVINASNLCFEGQHKCFASDAGSYKKPVQGSAAMGWCGTWKGLKRILQLHSGAVAGSNDTRRQICQEPVAVV